MTSQAHHKGSFPIRHAFVVQFASDTTLDAESMTGRIEHIVSGKVTRFESVDTMLAFVTQFLQAVADLKDC